MKTSNVLASMLFSSFAAAAPLMHKRVLYTVTSTLVQTEIIYTTVWDGEVPQPTPTASTSSAAAFFEKPSAPAATSSSVQTSAAAAPSSVKPSNPPPAPAPTTSQPPPVAVPTSTQAPPTSVAPPPEPTTVAPPPKPTTSAAPPPPKPTTQAPPPPPPAAPSPAPAPAPAPPSTPASSPSSGSGQVYSGGSMTLNYFSGGLGSCGKPIADTDMTVALASDLYGASTYDTATGNPTNKWCGQKVAITYKGKTTTATIMDKCAGCTNGGFDMTPSLWEAVTGTSVGDRITGMTWTTV